VVVALVMALRLATALRRLAVVVTGVNAMLVAMVVTKAAIAVAPRIAAVAMVVAPAVAVALPRLAVVAMGLLRPLRLPLRLLRLLPRLRLPALNQTVQGPGIRGLVRRASECLDELDRALYDDSQLVKVTAFKPDLSLEVRLFLLHDSGLSSPACNRQ
jgi:hypothetical protein